MAVQSVCEKADMKAAHWDAMWALTLGLLRILVLHHGQRTCQFHILNRQIDQMSFETFLVVGHLF